MLVMQLQFDHPPPPSSITTMVMADTREKAEVLIPPPRVSSDRWWDRAVQHIPPDPEQERFFWTIQIIDLERMTDDQPPTWTTEELQDK